MTPTDDTLTPRRRLFAAHLAAGDSEPKAAHALGISERTAIRWAKAPEVRAEVARLQDAALSAVSSRLRAGATDALDWLAAVGSDEMAPHAARVSAAPPGWGVGCWITGNW